MTCKAPRLNSLFSEKRQIRERFITEVEKVGIFRASKITGLSPNFVCKILNRELFVSPKTLRILTHG